MLASLPKLQTTLESLSKTTEDITAVDNRIQLLEQQRAYLTDATDDSNHAMFTLSKR